MAKGIYLLEGDRLKLCFNPPGGSKRPTEFISKRGSRTFLVVLKRDKK